jgi:hypothetical protein
MCKSKGGGGGDGGAAAREAARQARIAAGTDAVNKLFGIGDDSAKAQRDALYGTVGTDTRNYYSQQLEEDREAARRALDFQKARTGVAGSSQGIDLDSEFQKRYDRGLLDVGNRADSASSGMRTSDEQARLGLISKVASGIDQGSAVSSAMSQLQTNLENARNQGMQGRMANVFSDLIGGFTNGQANAGANAAKQQYDKNPLGNFQAVADYAGTVQRSQ